MKRIYLIDWSLIPIFILSAYSGIKLHLAAHSNSHEIWHNWALFHSIVSILFLIIIILHIISHRNWYKGIINSGVGKRSRITLFLSILFTIVSITGIILIFVKGANSTIGLLHYMIAILMSLFSIGHILKRIYILRKSLAKYTTVLNSR